MKQGKTLSELAREVQRQSAVKDDRLIPCAAMHFDVEEKVPVLHMDTSQARTMRLTDTAHRQVGGYLEIPNRYYEKMRLVAPELLTGNLNYWMERNAGDERTIRMLDGKVRAFLSPTYKRIDNDDILAAVAGTLGELGELSAASYEVTESRMYIKVVSKRLTREVSPGDIVQSGVCITNSEVGLGGFNAYPLVYRLVCSNGMVAADAATRIRAIHRGRRLNAAEDYSIYRTETIFTENQSILMKAVDMVKAALDEERFSYVVDTMREARQAKMGIHRIPEIVDKTAREYQINEQEKKSVLEHLIRDGDFTLYGLSNAVTRSAQDAENYDRATELESMGWRILKTPSRKWNALQAA